MGDPQSTTPRVTTEHTAEQIIHMVLDRNLAHATGLVFLAGGTDLPMQVATQSTNLMTILNHLDQVRHVASVKGYTDILELLDQKLPYETYG